MAKEEKIKVEMTIEDIINNEVFENALDNKLSAIRHNQIGAMARSNQFTRLDEMGLLSDAKKLRNSYLEILHKKSQLPSSLRRAVIYICQPILEKILKAAGAKPNK